MDRQQKEQAVQDLKQNLSESQIVLLLEQNGLTVAESTELRRKMSEAGARFKVMKNRLTRIAITGTDFENLGDLLKGTTVLAYSSDPVAPAKVANDFIKSTKDKLRILGGSMEGRILAEAEVQHLATLPSLDELRGKIVGLLQAPATKVAGVLQAPAGCLARVFGAYANQ